MKLAGGRRGIAGYITEPIAGLLARTPLSPNALTWLGFLVSIGAAALIVTGNLVAAGIVVLLAGFFDILDGALARRTNRTTKFGSVLDSTLDRLGEAVQLLGILVLFLFAAEDSVFLATISREWMVLVVGLALIGSLMVSYVRSRAEGAGIDCQVGLFTRTERVIVLALGLLLGQIDYALIIALFVIVIFSFITVVQRMFHIWRQTKL